jgi:hypothetical protein
MRFGVQAVSHLAQSQVVPEVAKSSRVPVAVFEQDQGNRVLLGFFSVAACCWSRRLEYVTSGHTLP